MMLFIAGFIAGFFCGMIVISAVVIERYDE